MLICLFAAFLFFVVRQPANDNQQRHGTVQPATTPLLQAVPTETPASLPLATFEHPEEDRQAA